MVGSAPDQVRSDIVSVAELAANYQVAFGETTQFREALQNMGAQVGAQYDLVVAAMWALENVRRSGQSFNEILAESTVRTSISTQLRIGRDAAAQLAAAGEQSLIEASKNALNDARMALQSMEPDTGGATPEPWMLEMSAHIQDGVQAIDQLDKTVDAVQATWDRMRDVNQNTLDVIGPAMRQQLVHAVDVIAANQEQLGIAGQRNVDMVLRLTQTVGVIAFLLAVSIAFVIGCWVSIPLVGLSKTTQDLANGNIATEIKGAEHGHELGQMARSLEIFRETMHRDQATAERSAKESAEQKLVVSTLSDGLKALANGQLNQRLERKFQDIYEPLRLNFNATLDRLEKTLGQVISASRNVENQDLSERTANQAATLEQSAAALDELTINIKSSAEQTQEVGKTVQAARRDAQNSEDVVNHAGQAMDRIEGSSQKISKIFVSKPIEYQK